MRSNVKKLMVCAASLGMIAAMSAMAGTPTHAEGEGATAYIRIQAGQNKDLQYNGVGAVNNTLTDDQVTNAKITEDGSYTVKVNADSLGEIYLLELCLTDVSTAPDVQASLDFFKINGEEVSLSGEPDISASDDHNSISLQLYYEDGGVKLFNRDDYLDATSIEIGFTVTGYPTEETTTTTEATTTAATTTAATTTAATTTAATTAQPKENPADNKTGDKSVTGIVVTGIAAAAVMFAVRKKED